MKTIHAVVAALPTNVRNAYDFGQATYSGALVPIEGIRCKQHGLFKQYAGNLRKGTGCPLCGAEQRARSKSAAAGDYYERVHQVHAGKYSYPNTVFKGMREPIEVVCAVHGLFRTSPIKHLYEKHGCPTCAKATRGHRKDVVGSSIRSAATKVQRFAAAFAASAEAVHGTLYDYSQVRYASAQTKVTIVCKEHGPFLQTPEHHLKRAYGCPACGNIKSKAEAKIADYLSTFAHVVSRDRTLLKPKELDILIPTHKLAVEYCGLYWHSDFSSEESSKNRDRHYQKYVACKEKGLRLLTVYDTEWEQRPQAIRRLLRNALGRGRGRLMARKCELRSVGLQEARVFYEQYHPQGGDGSGVHYGLYWGEKLVACMRFAVGVNDRGASASKRQWTLARYATRVSVAGGASRLFKAFLIEQRPVEVKSFSDNRYFSGDMYRQLGFALDAELAPDYQVWSPKCGLLPKTAYQRRNIPTRLVGHGIKDTFDPATDPRSEADMTYLMGCGRIYDCGKKRWLWTAAGAV